MGHVGEVPSALLVVSGHRNQCGHPSPGGTEAGYVDTKYPPTGTSLAVQRLKTGLPMQGTQV